MPAKSKDEVYLYVLAEEDSVDFTKVGMSAQRDLYNRLRMLNQGNPRELNFKHLWIASEDVVKRLEQKVRIEKDPFTDAGRTEWYKKSPGEMKEFLESLMANSTEEVVPFEDDWVVPYYAKNKNDCPIRKRYFTGKPLKPQVKELLNKNLKTLRLTQ